MLDANTFGVLHDLSVFVSIATALSLVAYRMMRQLRPEISWNQEGQVLSRSFGALDLLVLAGLGLFFIIYALQPQDAVAGGGRGE